jgi:predicted Rossmann-fold nucleotide-binding protein
MGLLNVNGFYDALIQMIQTMVDNGFLLEINRQMLLVSDDIEDLLEQMHRYQAPEMGQWLKREGV